MSQDFYLSGVEEIARERQRQVSQEGFTAAHDDQYTDQSLAFVAVHYATPPGKHVVVRDPLSGRSLPAWPHTWGKQWDKKKDHGRIRQLAIAGAECAAEIDRLKRKMIKDLAWLKKVNAANQAGQPGGVYTLDEIGQDLVKRGLLDLVDGAPGPGGQGETPEAQRAPGLWITEEGKAEIINITHELISQLYPDQPDDSPAAISNLLDRVLAKLQERQAGK